MKLILRNTNLVFQKGKYDEYESNEFTPEQGQELEIVLLFNKTYPSGTIFKIKVITSNNSSPVDDSNGVSVFNNTFHERFSPNYLRTFNTWVDGYTNNNEVNGISINRSSSHTIAGVTTKFYVRVFPQD